jgi:transposase
VLRHKPDEEAPVEGDVTRVLVGLDEYEVIDAVERDDGVLEVHVQVPRPEAACPGCGTFSARVKQRRRQEVRDGLSFERPTVLVWHKRRFRCDTPECRGSFTESTAQVPPRSRLTTRLRDAVGRAGRTRSTAEVAADYRIGWWTAWRAIAAAAAAAIAARPAAPPARLGLDETTFRRPQRFATGLVDLSTGELWDLVPGRSKAVVIDRLRRLDDEVLAGISDVVIDPFAGYKAAVRELVPTARRTADRFHVVRLANQAITDVRCRRQQELTGRRGRKHDPFYRARRDLLRARERLTDRQGARVQAALAADAPAEELWAAWIAKEGIRDLYAKTGRAEAEVFLDGWLQVFGACGIPELERLATTLGRWREEVLNYFDSRLTNGRTEGRNLTIKAVKRSGYGFRNFDNYRLRVLYRCS